MADPEITLFGNMTTPDLSVQSSNSENSLNDLYEQIRRCQLCPQRQKATQPVCGRGPKNADILFVGIAPGKEEDKLKLPFVGPSGNYLSKLLVKAGLDKYSIYFTNIVKCYVPAKQDPPAHTTVCHSYFFKELSLVNPKVVVLLGSYVTKALTKRTKSVEGEILQKENRYIISTYHPAAILRAPWLEVEFLATLKKVKTVLNPSDRKIPYKITTNVQELQSHFKDAKTVFFDLETTSLDFLTDKILSVALAKDDSLVYVIPLHDYSKKLLLSESDYENIKQFLNQIFSSQTITKVCHNWSFDAKFLLKLGIDVKPPLFDTMVGFYLYDENQIGSLNLKSLAWKFTDFGGYEQELASHLAGGRLGETVVDLSVLYRYNAGDVIALYKLYTFLVNEFRKPEYEDMQKLISHCMQLEHVLMYIGYRGVKVDVNRLEAIGKQLAKELEEEKQFFASLGIENVNSAAQVRQYFFEKKGLTSEEFTEKGQPSVGKLALKKLAEKDEVAKKLLQYREKFKLYRTYVIGLKKVLDSDNLVHPEYKQVGTVTGRLSCSAPNLQNIPADTPIIKEAFIARDQFVFVGIDFKQAEWRALAIYSKDEKMKEVILSGIDIHRKAASLAFNIPEDQVTDADRKLSKFITFGRLYGRSLKSICNEHNIPLEVAQKIDNLFIQQFPKASKWLEEIKQVAKVKKYVVNVFGRRRRLPHVDSSDQEIQAKALRQAVNSPIQSLVADFTNICLVSLAEKLQQLGGYPVAQIHDALIFEVPKTEVETCKKIIRQVVSTRIKGLFVPFEVDISVGERWSDLSVKEQLQLDESEEE